MSLPDRNYAGVGALPGGRGRPAAALVRLQIGVARWLSSTVSISVRPPLSRFCAISISYSPDIAALVWAFTAERSAISASSGSAARASEVRRSSKTGSRE